MTYGTQEQTNAMETLMHSLEEIVTQINKIEQDSRYTAADIYKLSNQMQVMRGELYNTVEVLGEKEQIDIFKVDHLLWKWKIYNMLLGFEEVDSTQAENYRGCKLGQWYYGQEHNLKQNRVFKQIEEPHKKIHILARKAVEYYNQQDIKNVENVLVEMEQISTEIIVLLEELKNIL